MSITEATVLNTNEPFISLNKPFDYDELTRKIDELKSSNTYNVVEISGLNPVWKDVMAVYAAKMPSAKKI